MKRIVGSRVASPGLGTSGLGALSGPGPLDDGMVTAELAVGLPTLMAVVAMAVALVCAVGAQLRCADAAAGAARMAARGELIAAVAGFVAADAPAGASVHVSSSNGLTTAVVSEQLRIPLVGIAIPVTVNASAVQPDEPGITP